VRHGESPVGVRTRPPFQDAGDGGHGDLRIPGQRKDDDASTAAASTSGARTTDEAQRQSVRGDGRHEESGRQVRLVHRTSAKIARVQVSAD